MEWSLKPKLDKWNAFHKRSFKIKWTFELYVDAHAHCTHSIVDWSINVLLWTGCLVATGNAVNTTFCGPARGTLLSNRKREKLNFDTNYKTTSFILHAWLYHFWNFLPWGTVRVKLKILFSHSIDAVTLWSTHK